VLGGAGSELRWAGSGRVGGVSAFSVGGMYRSRVAFVRSCPSMVRDREVLPFFFLPFALFYARVRVAAQQRRTVKRQNRACAQVGGETRAVA